MDSLAFGIAAQWAGLVLAFLRVLPLVMIAPLLAGRKLPWSVSMVVAVGLSWPFGRLVRSIPEGAAWQYWIASGLGEVLLGAIMGLLAAIAFSVWQTAIRIGMAALGMASPHEEAEGPVDAFVLLFALSLFFASRGHHLVFWAVARSFEVLPAGTLVLASIGSAGWPLDAAAFLGQAMLGGLLLALPIAATAVIADVTAVLVSRSFPGRVVSLASALKPAAGLLVLALLAAAGFPAVGGLSERLASLILSVFPK